VDVQEAAARPGVQVLVLRANVHTDFRSSTSSMPYLLKLRHLLRRCHSLPTFCRCRTMVVTSRST
jgi:hypothetical protein